MSQITLTPAQGRVLDHLDAYPKWHGRAELEQTRLLEPGDAAELTELVRLRLVMHLASIDGFAITRSGSDAAPRNQPPPGWPA